MLQGLHALPGKKGLLIANHLPCMGRKRSIQHVCKGIKHLVASTEEKCSLDDNICCMLHGRCTTSRKSALVSRLVNKLHQDHVKACGISCQGRLQM